MTSKNSKLYYYYIVIYLYDVFIIILTLLSKIFFFKTKHIQMVVGFVVLKMHISTPMYCFL